MPSPGRDYRPDVVVGHHPEYGIVAANPKQLPATKWMLHRLGFRPVPDHPTLHALDDQHRDSQDRATRAVASLTKAGYQVEADAAFGPSPGPPVRDRLQHAEPDVAFAEHPRLGVIAAASRPGAHLLLEKHGWRRDPLLDIYALPSITSRDEALGNVTSSTLSMQRAGLRVAVEPLLAQDVLERRLPAPTPGSRPGVGENRAARVTPISAAALAASPARTGLPGRAPVPAPAAAATVSRSADPRIAFSRSR